MSSCILDAINDVLGQIGAIPFDWKTVDGAEKSRPDKLYQLVRMWNNQIAWEKDGSGYTFEKPACFLELRPGETLQYLDNVTSTDYTFILHIVDMRLGEPDEVGMDQNLTVYEYRDKTKAKMVGFSPRNCSTMFQTDERQDYDHTDVYHYLLDFKSGMTDTKGSILDPEQDKVTYSSPPTNLELITGFSEGGETPVDPHTSYIWKVCEVQAVIVDVPDPTVTQLLGNGVTIPLQYALNADGTLSIPYIAALAGVTILTPFILGFQIATYVVFEYNAIEETYVFSNADGGGFGVGNNISFNASLPLGTTT